MVILVSTRLKGYSLRVIRLFEDFLVRSFRTQIYSQLKSIYNFFSFNEINESCGNYVALDEACF